MSRASSAMRCRWLFARERSSVGAAAKLGAAAPASSHRALFSSKSLGDESEASLLAALSNTIGPAFGMLAAAALYEATGFGWTCTIAARRSR